MQEKFGVVIEAVTTQFKAKMNEIKNMGQQTADRVKQSFSQVKIKPEIDNSNLIKTANATKDLQNALKQTKAFDVLDTGTLDVFTDKISTATGKITLLRNNFKLVKPDIEKATNETKKFVSAQKEVQKNTKSVRNWGNNIKSIGNEFGNAVKKVKKFALALLSVRSIYSVLSKASQAYMAFDTDLSDKLQSAWAGLGAQLAPIIEFIINLFRKAIAYVNAFIKVLTGINMVARANTKALNSQAGATKNASKALTSMDEITNIQKDAGGGAGGEDIPQIELPEVDTSKLENALNKIKEIASTLFEPIKNAWDTYGQGVINSFKGMLGSIWGLIKEIGKSFVEVWTNGTGEKIVGNILQIWQNVFDIIGGIATAIKNAWAENETGTQIIQFIADTYNSILDFVNSIADSLKKWVLSDSFQSAISAVIKIVKDLIGYISDIAKWTVDLYKKYVAPVIDEILPLISDVITMIGAIWGAIKPVVDKFVAITKTIVEPIIATITQMIRVAIQVIRDIVGAITWVANNWNYLWNGMKNVARTVVNGIIGFMNTWIRGLNTMLLPLRTTISLIAKAFGKNVSIGSVKIPSIPYLDSGTGYVPEDQLAYIHKGEAVIPKKFNSAEYFSNINDNTETNNLLLDVNRTLLDILDKDTNLYVNGKELARTTYNDFQSEANRLGKSSVVNVR